MTTDDTIRGLEERLRLNAATCSSMGRTFTGELFTEAADALRTALAQLDEARAERDKLEDEKYEPWPEWATAVLKVIRTRSGYDGYDDVWDGVDLPAELEETFSELEGQADDWKARAEATEYRLEELTRERDTERECKEHARKCCDAAEANLEEAKAVLGAVPELFERPAFREAAYGHGFDAILNALDKAARAFLHQGGSDAR